MSSIFANRDMSGTAGCWPPRRSSTYLPKTSARFSVSRSTIRLRPISMSPPLRCSASTSSVAARDGSPERRKKGGPGVGWMKGQFGLDLQGGPGAHLQGRRRHRRGDAVRQCHARRRAESGPGLGNLAYDSAHKQLFVSDLYTGMIHRFDLDGNELGRYDHGVTGLGAAKLATVPFDPKQSAQHRQRPFR